MKKSLQEFREEFQKVNGRLERLEEKKLVLAQKNGQMEKLHQEVMPPKQTLDQQVSFPFNLPKNLENHKAKIHQLSKGLYLF